MCGTVLGLSPVSSFWDPEFPMSAVDLGLPFGEAKADLQILSRPVGKCSKAVAINTVHFPLSVKGTTTGRFEQFAEHNSLFFL